MLGNWLKEILFVALVVDVGICSFLEHSHGANDTIKANSIADLIDGEDSSCVVHGVMYSFVGFVVFIVVFHFVIRYRHEKHLDEIRDERRYAFEWE